MRYFKVLHLFNIHVKYKKATIVEPPSTSEDGSEEDNMGVIPDKLPSTSEDESEKDNIDNSEIVCLDVLPNTGERSTMAITIAGVLIIALEYGIIKRD